MNAISRCSSSRRSGRIEMTAPSRVVVLQRHSLNTAVGAGSGIGARPFILQALLSRPSASRSGLGGRMDGSALDTNQRRDFEPGWFDH